MSIGALELGGSHVSAGSVDLASAEVEGFYRLGFDPGGSRTELLRSILEAARSISPAARCLGVAVPGPFDYERGICTIRGVGKLEGLYGVDLRRELARALPSIEAQSITFLNDAEAFLLGENYAGAARGHARAIGITLGTGLGSAFLVDGRIARDGPGVPPRGNLHLVPFRGGPVEDVLSGRGICARFDEVASVEEIAALAKRGDERARTAFAAFGNDLAEFLSTTCAEFGATSIIVGGSIARAWPHFGSVLRRRLNVPMVVAERQHDAPLLGAALAAFR